MIQFVVQVDLDQQAQNNTTNTLRVQNITIKHGNRYFGGFFVWSVLDVNTRAIACVCGCVLTTKENESIIDLSNLSVAGNGN